MSGEALLGSEFTAFSAWLKAALGADRRWHRLLYRQLMRSGRWEPEREPHWRAELPALARRAAELAEREQAPQIVERWQASDPPYGVVEKFRLRLRDGAEVETVSIPMAADRHRTVCVSTQVGCRQACAFCRTGQMGFVRNLTAAEIVGQVVAVDAATGRPARNVVCMGMGEPLDNAEAVAQALRVLADRNGLSLAWSHLTVSTVGRLAGLARWRALGLQRAQLAISLHAADDELRAALIPSARLEPLAELRRALAELPLPRQRRLLIAITVIPGVTDAPALLDRLCAWISGLPALVNLIPYNPIPGRAWRAPTAHEMLALRDALDARGVPVRLRVTKGRALLAACGQLATAGRRAGADRMRA
ncbi:MAG: 23S rRNA (adenine(2503)-C(2))-methyltransferase RlmN [Planctomycetota bacterium]|nr:23S rRNA (adenine(2503)-C(2))-methyltransferase RlmN [Planctomycetota bacterium]MCX8040534.1 23S rRNA (adenine(2503)-C(2))-methyltransferase RlmN [Planctomycetota bacterium]MDW8373295.1 23S rRNA (adenine(2503)-C(2))-methyltransferase RlmN [Planctomycetota bacterium]